MTLNTITGSTSPLSLSTKYLSIMKPQNIKAIIYDKRGRVLSIGQNNYEKSHPLQARHASNAGMPHRIYLHAEVHSIVRCTDTRKAHKMFVSRWDKKGNPMLARPCPVCMSAIKATGIKFVEYTTGNGFEVNTIEM